VGLIMKQEGGGMKRKSPYAYAKGVRNTRTQQEDDATLADLHERFKKPVTLTKSATEYHSSSKKQKGEVKQALPYFVGGTINGRRHDDKVSARTLLTLDIEAKDGQEQPPPPQEVFDKLESLDAEGWVYTSISHTEDAPRYRVVLPLAEHMESDDLNVETLKATTQAAAKKLDILPWCTPESWVLSQPMYLPAKLRGGVFWEGYTGPGKGWRIVSKTAQATEIADIPDTPADPVLHALQRAGLYLQEDAHHKGKHFITCPWDADHGKPTADDSTSTQTVYYEAHFDGNPRPAVRCMDTEPDGDGKPHLTYRTLVNWLRENGHLQSTDETAETDTVFEDEDAFLARIGAGSLQAQEFPEREWAWHRFAPVGKVTVLVGAGGSSKSALMLRMMYEGAFERDLGPMELGLRGPFRALYVTYEDDKQELNKRLHKMRETLREEHGDTFETLYGSDAQVKARLDASLFLHALDDTEIRKWQLATKDKYGTVQRGPGVEWLVRVLLRGGIRVLVLDPAGMTHGLDENDPADMAEYVRILADIAKRANCAVIVVAHATKMTAWAELEDINQNALRGSSATVDHSRSVLVLASMRQKWAPRFGLPASPEIPRDYAVLFHVKHNYSKPLPWTVLERKGVIVTPRPDLQPLSREDMQEQKAIEANNKIERDRESKAMQLAEYLDGCDNRTAPSNKIEKAVFGNRPDRLGVRKWCVEQGYVSVPVDVKNGCPKPHTLTEKGREALLS
jgi:KaiC/GvpD/RAD55 family RecA-like ATPase